MADGHGRSQQAASGRRTSQDADLEPPERGRRTDRAPRSEAATRIRLPNHEDEAAQRVKQLLKAVRGKSRALVLTHDNPDPDSMAAAVGLATVIESLGGVPTKVAFGGIVGRAENKALVRVLKLPLVPVSKIVFEDYDFICLVDTQPEFGNHSLLARREADAVVDHHPARPSSYDVPFADVGGDFGATASIVTGYVRAAHIKPSPMLATALFYGIKSDTRDLGRELGPNDVANYQWLFPYVDHYALSQIEHPTVSANYFAALHQAIERARRHGDSIVTDLGKVYAPDIVAEVADRFLSLDGVRWSLAVGEYEGSLYVSVRTTDRRMNAGRLVREIINHHGGSAGGHGSMAGGRLPLQDDRPRHNTAIRRKIIRTFLDEFGSGVPGEPIV